MKKILLIALTAALASATGAQAQTNFFWNGGTIANNPAAGGTGTWNTPNAWRTVSAAGSQGTWLAANGGTNNGFLAGTAGTITLGAGNNFTGANLTVNTAGYTITSASGSRNLVMTGTLALDANVALTIDQNNTGATWAFGTTSFGTGSSLRIQGIATANNANRVNLTTAGTISGGSITLNGTAAGVTGFVSTANIASGGVTLNTNITNNSSSSATMLGATSGNLLTYGGILSGSANLQISAGQAGGAGFVTLNGSNTYTGGTYLNHSGNGVLRIGVNNALPTGTTAFFAQSAGGGTADTGGTIDLNGLNLGVGALDGAGRGVANNAATASELTIGKASGTNTFSGIIGTVVNTSLTTQSNAISLVKTGSSNQILSGVNTYTGTTTVSAGTLALSGNGSIATSSGITINNTVGATLSVTAINPATFSLLNATTFNLGTTTGSNGLLDATGKTLNYAGTALTFNLAALGVGSYSYSLFDASAFSGSVGTFNFLGGYTGSFSTLANRVIGDTTFDFTAGTGVLSVTVIPEPHEYALMLAGLLGLVIVLRRVRSTRIEA